MPGTQVVLELHGIGKAYAQPVLDDIHLTLRGGEVLAITGENGAGKSTLSRIVAGLETPATGEMHFQGRPYEPADRSAAERAGVRMVMQELNLLPTLSVAENLFFNNLPHRFGWVDRPRLRRQAAQALAVVGLEAIDPDTLVGDLGIGQQQLVEIARNLAGDCQVLILDEPTAMLTDREVGLLFNRIDGLRERGVAIIYISHRLEELRRVAQRVAVLRDGKLVCIEPMERYSNDELVSLMAGREANGHCLAPDRLLGEPLLRVSGLSREGKVTDVSLEVRAGEIYGLYGLVGSGRTELLRLIYGADCADAGIIELGGPLCERRIDSPMAAVRAGIAFVSEDRKGEGLLLSESVAANLLLGHVSVVARAGVLDADAENDLARRLITALRIRTTGPLQAVQELSGGNQQKVVIGRWLERDCTVLLFDEPTRGIDVGAKLDIYALLADLARQGKVLLVVSSDLRELMHICDRVGVLCAGRLVAEFDRESWSEEQLLAAAFSGYQKPGAPPLTSVPGASS